LTSLTNPKKVFGKLTGKMRVCKICQDLPAFSHAVFAGKYSSKLMLIGQAPGKQELKYNMPFVGPAGKRLFKWLKEKGINEAEFRDRVYFTQMMKCFPGSGDRGDLKPNPLQLKNCASYLEREFELLKPKIVIPVGKLAIEKFFGKVKLDEVVGKKFNKEIFGRQTVVIPLPHPSGASPWSFKKNNQHKIGKAIKIIAQYFRKLKG
jgi:uracil-DNA glycosylase